MLSLRSKAAAVGSAVALSAGLLFLTPAVGLASAGHIATCAGGSIAGGTYDTLVVTGTCTVDSGSVLVRHNLQVRGGTLLAAFGGSDLTVDGSLSVIRNGILVLGCEPNTGVTCLNDASLATNDHVLGSLTAWYALAILVHHSTIDGNVVQLGGGGGLNCNPVTRLFGSPAFATYEDTIVGGNLSIAGWQSCWLGLFRATVAGNVSFFFDTTADPDGNEIATNTIGGNLTCWGNSPTPQVGDSGGVPNVVGGQATFQCASLTT